MLRYFLLNIPIPGFLFVDPFLLLAFRVCLCFTILSFTCHLVVTCKERADLLALLYVMFPCVFVTCPYGALGQVWY